MGRVAQNLREFEEARRNYQQALAIKIEYGDRYNQALTYHALGLLAEAKTALAIYVEYKDEYSASGLDAIQNYIVACRGTALPIRVNLTPNPDQDVILN
ncbi:hypothetical protein NIES2100_25820 [Calothrix sp. NIES-2100]|nr:hypothetical protein NIES2100_25820 [Calothrix sp. NIES-2100]